MVLSIAPVFSCVIKYVLKYSHHLWCSGQGFDTDRVLLATLSSAACLCVRLQIPECLAAPTPTDCTEKRAGSFCSPTRDGVFNVVGKNIVLHVGPDVQNALSCMIQADGVLMGCSTFGQVAGLFTKGIKMFSMQCGGASTPDQYKSIPPIAVSERGRLWVPIAGSWRDPVMASPVLFVGALDRLLADKGVVMNDSLGVGLESRGV